MKKSTLGADIIFCCGELSSEVDPSVSVKGKGLLQATQEFDVGHCDLPAPDRIFQGNDPREHGNETPSIAWRGKRLDCLSTNPFPLTPYQLSCSRSLCRVILTNRHESRGRGSGKTREDEEIEREEPKGDFYVNCTPDGYVDHTIQTSCTMTDGKPPKPPSAHLGRPRPARECHRAAPGLRKHLHVTFELGCVRDRSK